MKRLIVTMLTFSFIISICFSPVLASNSINSMINSQSSLNEIIQFNNMIEKEMSQSTSVLAKKYSKQADLLKTEIAQNENSNTLVLKKATCNLTDEIRKESLEQELEIASKYGYILMENSQTNANTRSVSSDLTWVSEVTMYHPETNTYRYTVDWNLDATDALYDTYDVAGVGITNPDNFNFAGTYGKTFSIFGESCYVDNCGNSSGTYPDTITKRAEDSNGVSYNINDISVMYDGLIMCSSGRITIYIQKDPTSSGTQANKFITSYNHNYKTMALESSATISFVGFDSSASLSVTYAKVNKSWQRASGGKTIYA